MSNKKAKDEEREKIAKDIEDFKKNGGEIEKLPAFGNIITDKKHISGFTKTKDKQN